MQVLHQSDGRLVQGRHGLAVGGNRAAFDAEWRGHKGVAEQQALLMDEGQNTGDFACAFSDQIMRLQTENIAKNFAPAKAVKKAAARDIQNKTVPGWTIAVRSGSHRHRTRAIRNRVIRGS